MRRVERLRRLANAKSEIGPSFKLQIPVETNNANRTSLGRPLGLILHCATPDDLLRYQRRRRLQPRVACLCENYVSRHRL